METETPEFTRTSLREFLHVIFKRKSQILVFGVTTVCVVTVGNLMAKPVYRANTQILVKMGRENIYVPESGKVNPVINSNRQEHINSEIEILESRHLADKVLAAIGPMSLYPNLKPGRKAISASTLPGTSMDYDSDDLYENALSRLQNNLAVMGVKKSNVIHVSFEHNDPRMAARVVNTLAEQFLDRHLEVFGTPHSYKFFEKQSQHLREKLRRTQETLQRLKKQHKVTELEEQQSIMLNQIADVRLELDDTLTRELELEHLIGKYESQLRSIPKTIPKAEQTDTNQILISNLEAQLMELQIEEKKLLAKYTDDNRLVRDVQQRIDMVERALVAHEKKRYGKSSSGVNITHQYIEEEFLRNDAVLKALTAKREALKVRLPAYEKELEQLNRIEVMHNELQQEVAVNRENYRLYLAKFEESRISNAMDSQKIASVKVIEPARMPLKPVKPKKKLNMLLGLFIGALGGLGLAFFWEFLDDGLERIEDFEKAFRAPVLATIPEMKK